MQLEPSEIVPVLKEKGVSHLYHANTVTTSCTFLRAGGLLSRGAVEQRGALQSPQKTDAIDREFGIWWDVFVDGVDIHWRGSRANQYGPVLFGYSVDLLCAPGVPPIWITKQNPLYWKAGQSDSERYFQSVDEFRSVYQYGDFYRMITLRNAADPISFDPFLSSIKVDDPGIEMEGVQMHSLALQSLSAAAPTRARSLIQRRLCFPSICKCKKWYGGRSQEELRALFLDAAAP